ncbi:MAG: hypothetical protein UW92_C0004G0005 [Candidatus Jorgensenbacteria bacterium GW2011_GWA2_45_13]|uniref:Uncharacterized protein n=1 Tax=Candidatus Jorgensenbacteria bacterium GW2011_GWA2_45_13 TaxID=1618662 RepID=A0A0G1NGI6_9BACT|nr:MAG: hypothetical protein UW92_C0004G0005 [Candidatus Jorgensenbacteria bacterium GW2011_GWA2_45_13]
MRHKSNATSIVDRQRKGESKMKEVKVLATVDGKTFIDPSEEILKENSGFIWSSDRRSERVEIISHYGWKGSFLNCLFDSIDGRLFLVDSKGESREIYVYPNDFKELKIDDFTNVFYYTHAAVNFSSWGEYDLAILKRTVKDLKDRETDLLRKLSIAANEGVEISTLKLFLEKTLVDIYDVNEAGGNGSRKKVRELIQSAIDLDEVRDITSVEEYDK